VQLAIQTNGCIPNKIMLLYFVQWKLDATILYSFFDCNG